MANEENAARLIEAINTNQWKDIFQFASFPEVALLQRQVNLLQDKIDPESFMKSFFGNGDSNEQVESVQLQQWLDSHKEKIHNPYMFTFLRSMTIEGDRAEIHLQTTILEDLIRTYPDRWESYLILSFSWISDRHRSEQYLQKAMKLAPQKEAVYLWKMILCKDNLKDILEYGNVGYAIHKNPVFLYMMAIPLKRQGKADEAKRYFQMIIDSETETSWLREKAMQDINAPAPKVVFRLGTGNGTMSQGTILLISFLAIFIVGGPIAKSMGSASPSIGIAAGVVVYLVLTVFFGGKR